MFCAVFQLTLSKPTIRKEIDICWWVFDLGSLINWSRMSGRLAFEGSLLLMNVLKDAGQPAFVGFDLRVETRLRLVDQMTVMLPFHQSL